MTPTSRSSTTKGVTGEGDHPLPSGPLLITDAGIIDHVVGQVRLKLPSDEADLVLSNRHTAVRTIEAGIHPCASLQLQHVLLFVERPNAGERRVQATDYGLCALLEDAPHGATPANSGALGESRAHVRS